MVTNGKRDKGQWSPTRPSACTRRLPKAWVHPSWQSRSTTMLRPFGRERLGGGGAHGAADELFSLTPVEQIFVGTNPERVDRGLPPIPALATQLDQHAQVEAQSGVDPALSVAQYESWSCAISSVSAETTWSTCPLSLPAYNCVSEWDGGNSDVLGGPTAPPRRRQAAGGTPTSSSGAGAAGAPSAPPAPLGEELCDQTVLCRVDATGILGCKEAAQSPARLARVKTTGKGG